jgi:DNA recombination protein RmuC
MTIVLVILMLLAIGLVAALVAALRRPTVDTGALVSHLATTNKALMDRGAAELDGKAALINRQLESMTGELGKVSGLVQDLERDRATQLGALAGQLREAGRQTQVLAATTQSLREVLSSPTARGQWGERMAEDVLRLAGLIEDVNYRKRRALGGERGVPDYTFLLPQGLCLNMDVKFPLNNYLRYQESESDVERERARKDFLRDVRGRLREITTRDYVDPGSGTVDCVLLFIPNEQVYAFIQEQDRTILDEALRDKVVFCSPLTLYAVLAVIRQAVDNFRLEQTSKEILELLHGFGKQWKMFVVQMDKVGRNLDTAHKAFGDLETTRSRQLERQLDKIENLRQQPELAAIDGKEEPERGSLALEA